MERKYYIDNLRWLAILLLFPFHAAQIWSGGEYSGFMCLRPPSIRGI